MRDLVLHPHPVLREICRPVGRIGPDEIELARELVEACVRERGAGIAAPQIGVARRALAVRSGEGHLVLFDPEIVVASQERAPSVEGCLSIPGRRFATSRSVEVSVAFMDVGGERRVASARGFLAFCLQHEIDHLDGVLLPDHGTEIEPVDMIRTTV